MKKIVIVGNGPAGVSAAVYAARSGVDTTVVYWGDSALDKAAEIENYYGFVEPISGKELKDNGIAQAKRLGVNFVEDEVIGIGFEETLVVEGVKGKYEGGAVILATGSSRKSPKIKGIKEFEGKGVSYCAICDGFFYKDKEVVVLGNGEYANHEAEVLRQTASKVTVLENIKEVYGVKTVEGVILENDEKVQTSGVFVALGTAGSADFAMKIGAMTDNNKIIVNENMETNVPGLLAAGDCTGGMLQVAKAVYEGAKAGLTAAKFVKK